MPKVRFRYNSPNENFLGFFIRYNDYAMGVTAYKGEHPNDKWICYIREIHLSYSMTVHEEILWLDSHKMSKKDIIKHIVERNPRSSVMGEEKMEIFNRMIGVKDFDGRKDFRFSF